MLNFVGKKSRPRMIRQGMAMMRVKVSTVLAQGRPSNQLGTPEERNKVIAKNVMDKMNLRFCMLILFFTIVIRNQD